MTVAAAFESLPSIEDWCLGQLARGALDRKSPFRWPVLASAGQGGGARARILVLRGFDRASRCFELWTDARSDKVGELRADPRCELFFFDASRMVQLRATCRAQLVSEGAGWEASFERACQAGLSDYSSALAPGSPINAPEAERDTSLAREHFLRLDLQLDRIDALLLSRDGHRRAVIDWTGATEHVPSRSWRVA